MFENVSVIGGDLRQLTVAKLLKAEGYHVFLSMSGCQRIS